MHTVVWYSRLKGKALTCFFPPDDNSDDYDMEVDMEAKWSGTGRLQQTSRAVYTVCCHFSPESTFETLHLTDPSSSDQIHVVTVSDTGRNWSDQEVRALIQVWSDERVCRQLESSTRKRDIFVQISNRLIQQGIERDWKQCHTKYKNLKYLYRSLQRGKSDEADPRRLMKFYDEVDAIMNRTTNGSPHVTRTADQQDVSGELVMLEGSGERDHVDVYLMRANTVPTAVGALEERTGSTDSVSSISLDVTPSNEERRPHAAKERRLDQQHRLKSEPQHDYLFMSNIKSCTVTKVIHEIA